MVTNVVNSNSDKPPPHPFRKAVIRGLGVVFPPLLTILIFLWVINTTQHYVLEPVTALAREGILWVWERPEIIYAKDLPPNLEVLPEDPKDPAIVFHDRKFRRVDDNVILVDDRKFRLLDDNGYLTLVPKEVYDRVLENPGSEALPQRGLACYRRFVERKYLKPELMVPFFLAMFILFLYLLGKFMAAGIGRFFWYRFERGIHRLPLVRNVYSSVKQVSDFLFTESEIEYTRVVAVEYPRRGIWSLGLVTGESMLDIRAAANEPILSVLMPTSPMPVTGFTVTVRKSETIDLNITIEQAFQFIVSCGVVVPPQQLQQIQTESQVLPAPADSAQPAASGQEVADGG